MSTPKLKDLSQLFILGDSYSDVGWRYPGASSLPDPQKPMGIDYPCGPTYWCNPEDWQTNWVQHVSADCQTAGQDLAIYDFAVGGAVDRDVLGQARKMASLLKERKSVDLDSGKAACVIWFGVNDICSDHPAVIETGMTIMKMILDECYDAGLRHVILMDVPPRVKLPDAKSIRASHTRAHAATAKRIDGWNQALSAVTDAWLARSGTTGTIFSAHQVFSNILDNPKIYGFEERDPCTQGAGIWADHVHPTTKMHRIVADAFISKLQ